MDQKLFAENKPHNIYYRRGQRSRSKCLDVHIRHISPFHDALTYKVWYSSDVQDLNKTILTIMESKGKVKVIVTHLSP